MRAEPQEGWVLKNWCFWILVLEKTLESPMDWKKIKPVNLKGNQPWIFIGRTDAEGEALKFWPPDAKSWLTGKDSDARKDGGQEKRCKWRMKWLDSITDSMAMNLSKLKEIVKHTEAWCAAVRGMQSWPPLSDWTTKPHPLHFSHASLLWFLKYAILIYILVS